MNAYRLSLQLTLCGPLLCRSSDQLRFGVDSHSLYHTDAAGRRRAAVAGTHIKGQLRHALLDLLQRSNSLPGLDIEVLQDWFGPPSNADAISPDWEPRRARLQFSPYWLAETRPAGEADAHTLHRIRIDADTGSVARGALLVIESSLASGEKCRFDGDIRFRATPEQALSIQRWIGKAASWLTALGSLKGIGFGQVHAAAATLHKETQAATAPAADGDESYSVWTSFGLDRPYCFAKAGDRRGNRFDSETFIPGAALRAALLNHAAQLSRGNDTELKALAQLVLQHNEELGFSHAQPLNRHYQRPAALPQSLVRVGAAFYDLAHAPEPALIDNEAPAFQIDWKPTDFDAAQQWVETPAVAQRLIVRTAIDSARGAAETGALFALQACEPPPQGFGAWMYWCGDADAAERGRVLDAARRLLPAALVNLGKTKARAVQTRCEARHRDGYRESETGQWFVTLQSAAALLPGCPGMAFANGGVALQQRYAETWRQLSAGALRLHAFFARQQIAGGRYLWERFWKKRGESYRPELLTSAGSVFVLQASDGQEARAAALLRHWADTGLPTEQLLPLHCRGWDRNPYQPQNGYGEILVNHAIHTDAALRPLQRERIASNEEEAA